jgi:hypothetical protein
VSFPQVFQRLIILLSLVAAEVAVRQRRVAGAAVVVRVAFAREHLTL